MGKQKPTFASLFSGCGGFDLGFIQAGFRSLGAFDVSPLAIDVLRTNLGVPARVADLSSGLPLDSIAAKCDIVIAGPPCQGFSTIGKRRIDDERNQLLITAAEIAAFVSPRVVLIENVAGAVAGKHRRYWDKAAGILLSSGYNVAEFKCEALNLGIGQIRKRVMLLAWKTKFSGNVTLPTKVGGTLRTILLGVDDAPNHTPQFLDPQSTASKIASHIRPRQKLSNVRASERAVHTWHIPEVYGRTTKWERHVLESLMRRRRQKRLRDFGDADPVSAQALRYFVGKPVAATLRVLIEKGYVRRVGGSYDLAHTFNGKFRRLSWDEPAPTVDTKFGDPYYFLHPQDDRAFTVREAARVQGFPDSFVFTGSERSQFQLVGNAVPPPLAFTLAEYIRNNVLV